MVQDKPAMSAVCFDLGDTLIVEETLVRDSLEHVVDAELVAGVPEVLEDIRRRGYKIALIANADSIDARNILSACRLDSYFSATIISGELGIEKPDRRIFQAALDELGVKPGEALMVGNRLDSDIVGANRVGIKSVWFRWNSRYDSTIEAEDEKPDFTIQNLAELLDILSAL
jgi:putative hydrolase of the HAD superfamily